MLDDILSILFPERCRGCGKNGAALCRNCLKAIPPANPIVNETMAFAVWKYHHKSPTAKILLLEGRDAVTAYLNAIMHYQSFQKVILVPIPQHYSKTLNRGFNQSLVITKWLKQVLPQATIQLVLQKTHATLSQAHTHARQERQKNLSGSMKAFVTVDPAPLYIIVDDVITTGSTITEASRALRAAGAKHICAIAIAHG
jgi:predicted amidophosphoribosyltransferase